MRKHMLSFPNATFLKPSFARFAGLALMVFASAPAIYSEGNAKWRIGPSDALISTTDKTIKGVFLYDSDGDAFEGLLVGMNVKIPASESEGNVESLLNDFSESWRLGPYLAKEYSIARDKLFMDISPQWSFRQYVFYPDFSNKKNPR